MYESRHVGTARVRERPPMVGTGRRAGTELLETRVISIC